LSHILQQRGHSNLAKILEQIPFSNEKIGENLEKILINDDAKQLLENSEFVKFVIYWIIASPLKDVQKGFCSFLWGAGIFEDNFCGHFFCEQNFC